MFNQSRISIPYTPGRNESINTTTFVADTLSGRDVDFSISTDSVNNNPITGASITITSLIQDHINRQTQNLIFFPPETQTYNPQNQLNIPINEEKNLMQTNIIQE